MHDARLHELYKKAKEGISLVVLPFFISWNSINQNWRECETCCWNPVARQQQTCWLLCLVLSWTSNQRRLIFGIKFVTINWKFCWLLARLKSDKSINAEPPPFVFIKNVNTRLSRPSRFQVLAYYVFKITINGNAINTFFTSPHRLGFV